MYGIKTSDMRGFRVTFTFDTAAEADKWARKSLPDCKFVIVKMEAAQ